MPHIILRRTFLALTGLVTGGAVVTPPRGEGVVNWVHGSQRVSKCRKEEPKYKEASAGKASMTYEIPATMGSGIS